MMLFQGAVAFRRQSCNALVVTAEKMRLEQRLYMSSTTICTPELSLHHSHAICRTIPSYHPHHHPAAFVSSTTNHQQQIRGYVSRAHPRRTPRFAVNKAIEKLIEEAEERIAKRKAKNEKYDQNRNHPDETVELCLALNLDPRKPGQTLRGSISLPHGTGRKVKCMVFSDDEDAVKAALEQGATHAGGEDLIDSVASGDIDVTKIDRAVASKAIMSVLGRHKKVPRMLGPRGLMPNPKTKTVFAKNDELLENLQEKLMGKEVVYKTELEGQILIPVGKVSFGLEKLLDNVGQAVKDIYAAKPEKYGKGKKPSSKGRYLLRAYVSTTQGTGVRLDLRSMDPNRATFLSDPRENPRGLLKAA